MLNKIIDLVKDQALSAITNNADVPADKKKAAVEATTSSIVDGLKSQLSVGNISNLASLFKGSSSASNDLSGSLQTLVVSQLAEKVGLSKSVATSIASVVIPAVMNMVLKKNNDPNDSFNIESLVQSIGGGGKGSGILGSIGKLFGGK